MNVAVVGSIKGVLLIGMSFEGAKKFASKMMMGMEVRELDSLAQSAISEMANMVCANACTQFSKADIGGLDISPPTLMMGTGGMATKIESAIIANRAGIEVVIASGHKKDVIINAANNQSVGTRFSSENTRLEARKNWIFAASRCAGKIIIDPGAEKAIVHAGGSLLAKGIVATTEHFSRGYVVCIVNQADQELARGVVRYKKSDIEKIKGLHSEQIEAVLGFEHGRVVIHRDDLVLL